MAEKLPIVYVRGFAGDTSGINRAVADPFYGFNEGSTHVRVGGDGEPVFYQFESPLLRLLLDEQYEILVDGGQLAFLESHDKVAANSIWIHRFYDVSASTWGQKPQDYRLERAAEDLLRLIETLQTKTGAPRVHLVAHSMGGLICRSLLQKIIPDQRPGRTATDYVDKFFTYATPHGGIVFDVGFGLLERLRDAFGVQGADIFGPRRMYQYLTPVADLKPDGPPDGWKAEELPDGSFPKERIFCLIGTNPRTTTWQWGCRRPRSAPRAMASSRSRKPMSPGPSTRSSIAATAAPTAWSTPKRATRTYGASCSATSKSRPIWSATVNRPTAPGTI
jgi:pimeloyl-ACP methyl ester carboxylesterase